MKIVKQYILPALKIIGLALVLVIGARTALSWTGPSAAPPSSNKAAPLNTSSAAQTKLGELSLPKMIDTDNSGYYADPHGNSWFNRLYSHDIRSGIFYDLDDITYYVNPAETSKFNEINLGGVERSTWPSGEGGDDTRCDISGTCSQVCIGSNCKTSWPSGGGGGSLWSKSGSDVYRSSGNVGVGTMSPTSKLHVKGSSGTSGAISIDTPGQSQIEFLKNGAQKWAAGIDGSDFHIYDWAGTATRLFIKNSSGNVGIGTMSPSQKLDVAGYVKGRTGLCIGDDCKTSWPSGGGGSYLPLAGGKMNSGATIDNAGRMHLASTEDIYLLARGGDTYVSNAWGGSGNLRASGTICDKNGCIGENEWTSAQTACEDIEAWSDTWTMCPAGKVMVGLYGTGGGHPDDIDRIRCCKIK